MLVFCTLQAKIVLIQEMVHVLLPLLRHVVLRNDGNYRPTMPVIKERRARDPLLDIIKIWGPFYKDVSSP